MNVALFQVTTTHKNGSVYAKTLLLETSIVCDFQDDPGGAGTVFYYRERQDRKFPATLFKTNMTSEAFHALLLEAENEQWLYLEVTEIRNEYYGSSERPSIQTRRVNVEQIIKGYDRDSRSSFIWVNRGPFEVLRFKTSHTIDEIDNVASESFSISVSGS